MDPHFHLNEFFVGCSDVERKIAYQNPVVMDNILRLSQILEHARMMSCRCAPIRINSCYRDEAHNKRVGGATFSQHKNGSAVDLWCVNLPNLIEFLKKTYAYHQIIIYYLSSREVPYFVHFGLPTGHNDGQIIYKQYKK